MRQFACAFIVCAVATTFAAAPTVHVSKEGASRVVVSIETAGGVSAAAYNRSLQKNLELTGYFQVGPNGQIRVTGAPGGTVTATGADQGFACQRRGVAAGGGLFAADCVKRRDRRSSEQDRRENRSEQRSCCHGHLPFLCIR